MLCLNIERGVHASLAVVPVDFLQTVIVCAVVVVMYREHCVKEIASH